MFNNIKLHSDNRSAINMTTIKKKKCMIYQCYSYKMFIPPGTHFTVESTEAMGLKCLAKGHNILMPDFKRPTLIQL